MTAAAAAASCCQEHALCSTLQPCPRGNWKPWPSLPWQRIQRISLVAVPSLLQGLKVVVGPLLAQAGVVLVVGLARGQPGHRERVVARQLGVVHLALASSVELVKIFNVETPY